MTSDGLKQLLERNGVKPTNDKRKDIEAARVILEKLRLKRNEQV